MNRATKIVATIGPASREFDILTDLILTGVNVARLNFSHGNHQIHGNNIRNLRKISENLGLSICILLDLQGPKIRVGNIPQNIDLKPNDPLTLVVEPGVGGPGRIPIDYPDLPAFVEPGGRILLDDGSIELIVETVHTYEIGTRVVTGGILKPNKGVNLPGVKIGISSLTVKDRKDLEFGLNQGVDMVALSFVRSANDILECKKAIREILITSKEIPVIAKLEKPEALDNLDEIVRVADGVMVARGDLGVEMSPEEVPIAQKRIIECANRHGRVVITATQMLDSMINNPRPTRAEASDVANAILDGTDAVMLSGETAVGSYPIQSVQMMDKIICQAETHMGHWGRVQGVPLAEIDTDDTYYVTQAARTLARDRNVAAVAVFTLSGRTARIMAKMRPDVPILAFTSIKQVYQQLSLYRGVYPHLVPHAPTIEIMLAEVDRAIMQYSPIKSGQQVVLVCGYPINSGKPANLALLHSVGDNRS